MVHEFAGTGVQMSNDDQEQQDGACSTDRRKLAYISDGYTEAFVSPETRSVPEIRGTCRRMPWRERAEIRQKFDEISDDDPGRGFVLMTDILERVIITWDVVDETGAPVELTRKHLENLEPAAVLALYSMVFGNETVVDQQAADVKN